jgi:hypothetical protein
MITTINYAPSYLQGTYNPIIWSVTSNQITQLNFSYVFDVYINGTFEIRLKVKPNPAGVGMVDISQICQAYLKNDRIPETVINTTTFQDLFADNTNSSLHLFLKVGEEYGGFLFNGVNTGQLGAPAYNLWARTIQSNFDIPVHVWNSSLNFRLQQDGMSNGYLYSGGYGLLPSQTFTYDWGQAINNNTLAYPLSYNTLKQKVYYNDLNILSFINWTQYPNVLDNSYIAFCMLSYYDKFDNPIVTNLPIEVSNVTGFSQKIQCNNIVIAQLDPEFDILHVQCRLASLIEMINLNTGGSYVMSEGQYIEVQMYNHAVGNGCLPGVPVTQASRFTMLEDCDTLYTRVRLSWLNELGGRDYMNFTAFMEKDTTTTNDNYYQEAMNWSALKPVTENVTNPNFNLQTKGGEVIYNKQAMTSWTLNTDWLTQDEVNLLEGLQKSSNVIAYFNDNPYNVLVPYSVRIGQTSYKTKNIKQVKLVQGEFEIFLNQTQKIN